MATDRFFVNNLTLENFRCFEKVELGPFDPHFNLLVGTNGSGKSSVLLALANLYRTLARGTVIGESKFGERDGRVTDSTQGAKVPFARRAPWRMRSEFTWKSISQVSEDSLAPGPLYRSADVLWPDADAAIPKLGEIPEDWPGILLLYTTDRRFQTGDLRERMRLETLALQDRARLLSSASSVAGENTTSAKASIGHLVQQAICDALENATSVEYLERRQDIVVQFSDGSAHEFSQMSDGQRALIGLVGDIVWRACSVHKRVSDFDGFEETPGLVLIDELDLHLHPRWQRRVIGDLKRIFPNIQFFATTHSPQIIGEARPEEIVMLRPSGQKGQRRPTASYGMNSDWVLKCVMEAEDRDPGVAMEIKLLFDEIEDGKFDEARTRIERLRREIGEMPDLVGAESYIWRVEHEDEEAAE